MSEQKPQKRLVSKRRYVQHIQKCLALGSVSVLALALGTICVFATAISAIVVIVDFTSIESWLSLLALTVTSAILLYIGGLTKLKVESSQPLAPITSKNAHLLPAEETLLRGSNLPPTVQQAELLRATQTAQETPQEQLLKAATGNE